MIDIETKLGERRAPTVQRRAPEFQRAIIPESAWEGIVERWGFTGFTDRSLETWWDRTLAT